MIDSKNHLMELKEFKNLRLVLELDMSYVLPGLNFGISITG